MGAIASLTLGRSVKRVYRDVRLGPPVTLTPWAQSGPVRNVLAYGATGNGYTDDTAAVQAAAAALQAGETLYFPAGTYVVGVWQGTVVTINQANVTVRGDGPSTVIKAKGWPAPPTPGSSGIATGPGGSITLTTDQAAVDVMDRTGTQFLIRVTASGVTVRDLVLDGNRANWGMCSQSGGLGSALIYLDGEGGALAALAVARVEGRNGGQIGLFATGSVSRVIISDCWFHHNGQPRWAWGQGVWLDKWPDGPGVYTHAPSFWVFDNCTFSDNYGLRQGPVSVNEVVPPYGIAGGGVDVWWYGGQSVFGRPRYVVLNRCLHRDNQNQGGQWANSGADDVYYWIAHRNRFEVTTDLRARDTAGAGGGTCGLEMWGQEVLINGCTFSGGTGAVALEGNAGVSGYTYGGLVVNGCQFEAVNAPASEGYAGAVTVIKATSAGAAGTTYFQNMVVCGNTLTNHNVTPVDMRDGYTAVNRRSVVAGNRVSLRAGTDPVAQPPIGVAAGVTAGENSTV